MSEKVRDWVAVSKLLFNILVLNSMIWVVGKTFGFGLRVGATKNSLQSKNLYNAFSICYLYNTNLRIIMCIVYKEQKR